MNYRQWKKNYKKMYGVNPPLLIDKRKRRKLFAKVMVKASNAFEKVNREFRLAGHILQEMGEKLHETEKIHDNKCINK